MSVLSVPECGPETQQLLLLVHCKRRLKWCDTVRGGCNMDLIQFLLPSWSSMFYHVLSILDSEICRYRNIRNVKSNRCTTKHCVELGSTHSQGHDELYWPAELLSTQATQLEIELNSLEKLTGSCCPSQESSWRLWRPRRSRKHGLQTKCSHFYIFQIWILLLTVRPSISLWPIIYRMPDAKIQVYNVVLLLYI